MADRIRHINTRNLVVCETFDDFAAAVNKTDFTVEDIVGYVTSLANVYYWLNIESIWGAIGFTWIPSSLEPLSDEEALKYPNPLYRLTQVTAEGENIPMDEQWLIDHKLSKGTGVFNRTTILFSHIPKIPDGHRITAITGATLANINPDIKTIYIDKSNWANLAIIDEICNRGITIYADLDNSNIISANSIITFANTDNTNKLYLKADLSKIPDGTYLCRAGGIFAANDYYKDLNIPIGEDSSHSVVLSVASNGRYQSPYLNTVFSWEGTGPFKLEHFFEFKDYNNVYIHSGVRGDIDPGGYINIWSTNGKYNITNFRNYSYEKGLFPRFCDAKAKADENTVIDLTIDCTNGVSDVRCDYDLADRENRPINANYFTYKMLPIKYEGNVTSIGVYNPCLIIENDEWPEFNQSLVNKLNPDLGQQLFKAIKIVNAAMKCPYTIDVRNLEHINVFNYGNITYNPNFELRYNITRDILPNIIVDENKVYSSARFYFSTSNTTWTFPIKKLKVIDIFDKYEWQSIFFDEGTMLIATNINGSNYHAYWKVYNSEIPVITLKKLDTNTNIKCNTFFIDKVIGDYTDLYIIDATNSELISNEPINTSINFNTTEVRHPLVLCNINLNENVCLGQHYTNFRLIYRSHISQNQQYALSYNGYTDAELTAFANSFVETGNNVEYQITVKSYIYSALERLNLIGVITSKGYNVINQL